MTARTCLVSGFAALVLVASGLAAAAALPATAAPAPSPAPSPAASAVNKYVSLGDSFAAGQGAGGYLNACLQSTNGYPALLDAVKGTNLLRNASCRNATTATVTSTQLSVLNQGTTLVTLTVGGNDLNVAGVAALCTTQPTACDGAIAAAQALLVAPPGGVSELATRLTATYARVAAAAPNARIVVTGYPYLFELPPTSDPRYGTIVALSTATAALNATISGAVDAEAAQHVKIGFVDVSAAFFGHGIGSPDAWINDAGPDVFHPTVAGYRAYAGAIKPTL